MKPIMRIAMDIIYSRWRRHISLYFLCLIPIEKGVVGYVFRSCKEAINRRQTVGRMLCLDRNDM